MSDFERMQLVKIDKKKAENMRAELVIFYPRKVFTV
jgi:hypothetical protein